MGDSHIARANPPSRPLDTAHNIADIKFNLTTHPEPFNGGRRIERDHNLVVFSVG